MRRQAAEPESTDGTLIPIMNLVCLLIPFLLLTASFVQYATIRVQAPRFVPSGPAPGVDPPLGLTVMVTDRGFTLTARGRPVGEDGAAADASDATRPTVPAIGAGGERTYDWNGLAAVLRDLKDENEKESEIRVVAERNVDYATIVRVMDTAREDEEGEMFTEVTMLAGVM